MLIINDWLSKQAIEIKKISILSVLKRYYFGGPESGVAKLKIYYVPREGDIRYQMGHFSAWSVGKLAHDKVEKKYQEWRQHNADAKIVWTGQESHSTTDRRHTTTIFYLIAKEK